MQGWSKGTTYISVVMMGAGFVLLLLGWNGAAGVDYVQGQIPYVISGGIAGMGLIGAGLVLALVQELRRTSADLQRKMDEVVEALNHTALAAENKKLGRDAVPAEFDESQLSPRAAAARRAAMASASSN